MRRWLPGLLIAGLLTTGCKEHYFQVSVNPFFPTTEAPGDVTGRWVSEDEDPTGLVFAPAQENEWRVDVFDPKAGEKGGEAEVLGVMHFGRVGGTLYWDMTAQHTGTGDLSREHLLELHSVARVRLDGEAMEVAFLKPEWMSAALADGRVNLAHFDDREDDDEVVLTARTADLEAFLQEFGDDPEAFGETLVLHRVQ